jgi:hypothetical protein
MGIEPLELRTNAMLQALKQARQAVPGVAELDPALGGRFEPRFRQLADEVESGLSDGADADETAKLLRKGEDLVAEALAFLGGAAARKFSLDRGVTSMADDWLDQLSQEAGLEHVAVVIPASSEFTGMVTQVVRLRLPSDGIWGLPVAVHEYGHFVASVFTIREERDGIVKGLVPVEDAIHGAATREERPKLYWHGHELFADALAVATTGPAYTRYCIHYRFDAASAQEDSPTHPEPARRIRLQLKVLDKVAAESPNEWLKAEADELRKTWSTALKRARVAVRPARDQLLDPLEDRLIALLDEPKLAALRYRDHLPAATLALDFLNPNARTDSVAVALNAAWAARAAKPDSDLEAIAVACERMVKEVLARG